MLAAVFNITPNAALNAVPALRAQSAELAQADSGAALQRAVESHASWAIK